MGRRSNIPTSKSCSFSPVYDEIESTTLGTGVDSINALKEEIVELRRELSKSNLYQIYECDITAYSLSRDQVGNDPANTAIMESPKVGGVAVSRDLEWMLGTRIKIDGVGLYRVNDLMAKTLPDGTPITQRIDIYMGRGGKGSLAYKKAIQWGIQTKKVVVIAGKN